MSSMRLRYRAIGSCAGYLRAQSTSCNLQQQFRLATTAAKSRAPESKTAATKSRFTAKRTVEQDTKISQSDVIVNRPASVSQDAATRTVASRTPARTTPTQTTPNTIVATPSSRRPPYEPLATEKEAEPQAEVAARLDPKSKEYKKAYKSAARKYTALMVSIPLAIVTTYFLFKKITPELGARRAPAQNEQTSNA